MAMDHDECDVVKMEKRLSTMNKYRGRSMLASCDWSWGMIFLMISIAAACFLSLDMFRGGHNKNNDCAISASNSNQAALPPPQIPAEPAVEPAMPANADHLAPGMGHSKGNVSRRKHVLDFSHGKIATWTWYYLERIQALKAAKIVWDNDTGVDIWVVSVDGTHCWIHEPKHPTLSINGAYYSHKRNKAGIDYEFGISPSKNRLVWMNGPRPAGDPDLTVFTLTDGLRDKLKEAGKRGIFTSEE